MNSLTIEKQYQDIYSAYKESHIIQDAIHKKLTMLSKATLKVENSNIVSASKPVIDHLLEEYWHPFYLDVILEMALYNDVSFTIKEVIVPGDLHFMVPFVVRKFLQKTLQETIDNNPNIVRKPVRPEKEKTVDLNMNRSMSSQITNDCIDSECARAALIHELICAFTENTLQVTAINASSSVFLVDQANAFSSNSHHGLVLNNESMENVDVGDRNRGLRMDVIKEMRMRQIREETMQRNMLHNLTNKFTSFGGPPGVGGKSADMNRWKSGLRRSFIDQIPISSGRTVVSAPMPRECSSVTKILENLETAIYSCFGLNEMLFGNGKGGYISPHAHEIFSWVIEQTMTFPQFVGRINQVLFRASKECFVMEMAMQDAWIKLQMENEDCVNGADIKQRYVRIPHVYVEPIDYGKIANFPEVQVEKTVDNAQGVKVTHAPKKESPKRSVLSETKKRKRKTEAEEGKKEKGEDKPKKKESDEIKEKRKKGDKKKRNESESDSEDDDKKKKKDESESDSEDEDKKKKNESDSEDEDRKKKNESESDSEDEDRKKKRKKKKKNE